ncbi:MAG: carotenoid biosynthesis protein [Deltaproteobacteria bacterium]|nr:carotenoid biosynthesis protein [Deltaproteobacteria bacterium]
MAASRPHEAEATEPAAGDGAGVGATPHAAVPPTARGGLLRRAGRELWAHLPAWLAFVYAVSLLNAALTNLRPPRPDFAPTVLFPLAAFAAYFAARAAGLAGWRERWRLLRVPAALAVGLPLLVLLVHRPSPLHDASLRWVYEITAFAWAGLLLGHAASARRNHAGLFFGPTLVYGVLLENGGIGIGFFSESRLRCHVPGLHAPLSTMLGWCTVMYMCTFITWELRRRLPWLRRSPALSALLLAATGILLDLQIDPLATALGCWTWNRALPPAFLGVPLLNFVAWACALWPFGYVLFRLQERRGIEDGGRFSRRDLLTLLLAAPVTLLVAAALFILVTLLLEGPQGPAWQVLHRFTAGTLGLMR